MKRKVIILASVMLVLILVSAGVRSYLKYEAEKVEVLEVVEYLQYLHGYAKWTEVMEEYSLAEDVDNEEIIKKYKEILDTVDMTDIEIILMSKIIYMNEVFGVEDYDYLIDDIDDYYDDKTKLFCDCKVNKVVDMEDLYESNVATTSSVYEILMRTSVNLAKYEDLEGLKKYHSTSKDKEERGYIEYLFESLGRMDELEYMKDKEYFQGLYDECLAAIDYDDYQVQGLDVDSECFLYVCDKMDIDTSQYRNRMKEWRVDESDIDSLLSYDTNSASSAMWTMFEYYEYLMDNKDEVVLEDWFAEAFEEKYREFGENTMIDVLDECLEQIK